MSILVVRLKVKFFCDVADGGEDFIVAGVLNQARVRVDNFVTAASVATDLQIFSDGELHFVSIAQRIFHAERLKNFHAVELSDSFDCVDDLLTFPFQLRGIAHVLKLTAAAIFIQRTKRFHSFCRRLDDFNQSGDRVIFFDRFNFRQNFFARQRTLDKNNEE